jgi:phytoene synthase
MTAPGRGSNDAPGAAAPGEAHAQCEALLRAHDRERYLAALFAPADLRPHLHALAAYNLEIARVREVVSQPLAGEIRLQWWRDAIEGHGHGDVAANPTAAALLATVEACGLPRAPLVTMAEARIFDLYDDPMPSLADLEGYAGETRSALVQLCALVLGRGGDPGTAEAAGHAGVAQTLAAVIEAFPLHARRGQVYLPRDVLARHGADPEAVVAGRAGERVAHALDELADHARHHFARARRALAGADPAAAAAFLPPLALAPRLERLLRRRGDPYAAVAPPPGWRLQLDLWTTARRLRRLFPPR